METITRYIPREYLALKINYLKDLLKSMPDVRIANRKRYGKIEKRCLIGSHNYALDNPRVRSLSEIATKRQEIERFINLYETDWKEHFTDSVPANLIPRSIPRTLNPNNPSLSVLMDKQFFDSLKNDANPYYREFKKVPYNGILYRSQAEAEIARFYTENSIPFKYEPEIYLDGMQKPYHPDFVMLIKEINSCKIHEHLGMLNSSDYLRDNKIKITNYLNAGLVPGHDLFFTYGNENMIFSVDEIMPMLNSIIYNSLISSP
ncbi:MAG: hypothetical protein IKW88_03980 [Clostridiales bacterium]|nr:hypothetical protein [Clostridiales bacterium]